MPNKPSKRLVKRSLLYDMEDGEVKEAGVKLSILDISDPSDASEANESSDTPMSNSD